ATPETDPGIARPKLPVSRTTDPRLLTSGPVTDRAAALVRAKPLGAENAPIVPIEFPGVVSATAAAVPVRVCAVSDMLWLNVPLVRISSVDTLTTVGATPVTVTAPDATVPLCAPMLRTLVSRAKSEGMKPSVPAELMPPSATVSKLPTGATSIVPPVAVSAPPPLPATKVPVTIDSTPPKAATSVPGVPAAPPTAIDGAVTETMGAPPAEPITVNAVESTSEKTMSALKLPRSAIALPEPVRVATDAEPVSVPATNVPPDSRIVPPLTQSPVLPAPPSLTSPVMVSALAVSPTLITLPVIGAIVPVTLMEDVSLMAMV